MTVPNTPLTKICRFLVVLPAIFLCSLEWAGGGRFALVKGVWLYALRTYIRSMNENILLEIRLRRFGLTCTVLSSMLWRNWKRDIYIYIVCLIQLMYFAAKADVDGSTSHIPKTLHHYYYYLAFHIQLSLRIEKLYEYLNVCVRALFTFYIRMYTCRYVSLYMYKYRYGRSPTCNMCTRNFELSETPLPFLPKKLPLFWPQPENACYTPFIIAINQKICMK